MQPSQFPDPASWASRSNISYYDAICGVLMVDYVSFRADKLLVWISPLDLLVGMRDWQLS